MAKLGFLVLVCCVVGCAFAAPSPKTVINAADNDVAPDKQAESGVAISAVANVVATPPRKPVNPNLYNDIFNIPTSILTAVNRLLTGGVAAVTQAGSGIVSGGSHGGGLSLAGGGAIGNRNGAGGELAGGITLGGGLSGAGAGTGAGGVAFGGGAVKPGGQGNNFFDNIFNIPISALNAVNQLLNNNQKTAAGK